MTHAEMDAIVTRFARLLELALDRRLFVCRGDQTRTPYQIRKIHDDGLVQLRIWDPETGEILDRIVEPETLVPA